MIMPPEDATDMETIINSDEEECLNFQAIKDPVNAELLGPDLKYFFEKHADELLLNS